MKISACLYITKNGGIRLTKNRATIQPGEVAFDFMVEVDPGVFRQPDRRITLTIPAPPDESLTAVAEASYVGSVEPEVICSGCSGSGIRFLSGVLDEEGRQVDVTIDCPICGGSSYVPESIARFYGDPK